MDLRQVVSINQDILASWDCLGSVTLTGTYPRKISIFLNKSKKAAETWLLLQSWSKKSPLHTNVQVCL